MLNLNVPVNPVSFGQVGFNLLKQAYKLGEEVTLFPIHQIDPSAFKVDAGFSEWVQSSIGRVEENFNRENPTLKLWHINGLFDSVGSNPYAFTFHETDRLTKQEITILRSLKGVFVSSRYTKKVFEDHGIENVIYCPLGFDTNHFHEEDVPVDEGVVVFGLRGKLEKRKHTVKVLLAWAKEFGGDPAYRLDCSIFNQFLDPAHQNQIVGQAFADAGMEAPWNMNFLPMQPRNEDYNLTLNASHIDLTGMSGCEGFNLPFFQSLCLGKHAVALDAHVHKDFADKENSSLVNPSGMIDVYDGIFFQQGAPFNQGQIFDWKDEDFISACHDAIQRYKEEPVNFKGQKLKYEFSYKRTWGIIKENLTSKHL